MKRDRAAHRWVLADGQWLHRPRLKVAANAVLRAVQPRRFKWIVFSRCEPGDSRPRCVGYGFGPVFHDRREAA